MGCLTPAWMYLTVRRRGQVPAYLSVIVGAGLKMEDLRVETRGREMEMNLLSAWRLTASMRKGLVLGPWLYNAHTVKIGCQEMPD